MGANGQPKPATSIGRRRPLRNTSSRSAALDEELYLRMESGTLFHHSWRVSICDTMTEMLLGILIAAVIVALVALIAMRARRQQADGRGSRSRHQSFDEGLGDPPETDTPEDPPPAWNQRIFF